jgi:hypothetical protein
LSCWNKACEKNYFLSAHFFLKKIIVYLKVDIFSYWITALKKRQTKPTVYHHTPLNKCHYQTIAKKVVATSLFSTIPFLLFPPAYCLFFGQGQKERRRFFVVRGEDGAEYQYSLIDYL